MACVDCINFRITNNDKLFCIKNNLELSRYSDIPYSCFNWKSNYGKKTFDENKFNLIMNAKGYENGKYMY